MPPKTKVIQGRAALHPQGVNGLLQGRASPESQRLGKDTGQLEKATQRKRHLSQTQKITLQGRKGREGRAALLSNSKSTGKKAWPYLS